MDLPNELLALIFCFLLDGGPEEQWESLGVLLCVSRHFCMVALNTKGLWKHIDLSWPMKRIQYWISRLGSVPAILWFTLTNPPLFKQSSYHWPHGNRINSCHLVIVDRITSSTGSEVSYLDEMVEYTVGSAIRMVGLDGYITRMDVYLSRPTADYCSPTLFQALQQLSITDSHPFTFSRVVPPLRSLKLCSYRPMSSIRLRSCLDAVRTTLEELVIDAPIRWTGGAPVILKSLTTLDVKLYRGAECLLLFDAQNLASVSIRLCPPTASEYEAFNDGITHLVGYSPFFLIDTSYFGLVFPLAGTGPYCRGMEDFGGGCPSSLGWFGTGGS